MTPAELGAHLRHTFIYGGGLRGRYLDHVPAETQIANLDKVRGIILIDPARLEMGQWQGDDMHCLSTWLQVSSDDPAIRQMDAHCAGFVAAPIAAMMFFSSDEKVLQWLTDREYVNQLDAAKGKS